LTRSQPRNNEIKKQIYDYLIHRGNDLFKLFSNYIDEKNPEGEDPISAAHLQSELNAFKKDVATFKDGKIGQLLADVDEALFEAHNAARGEDGHHSLR
jgi:hypothetical protein